MKKPKSLSGDPDGLFRGTGEFVREGSWWADCKFDIAVSFVLATADFRFVDMRKIPW